MIRVEEIKCKNCFGREYRGRVPTDTQELAIAFEKPIFGASAETDTDGVITRNVDNEYPLDF